MRAMLFERIGFRRLPGRSRIAQRLSSVQRAIQRTRRLGLRSAAGGAVPQQREYHCSPSSAAQHHVRGQFFDALCSGRACRLRLPTIFCYGGHLTASSLFAER